METMGRTTVRFLIVEGDPNQVGHQTSICWIAQPSCASQKIELR